MQAALEKARTLVEALPYLARFAGATFVIKLGGHAMKDDALLGDFASDVSLLAHVGIRPIVVHGGGPQIDKLLARLGHESQKIGGMRVTDGPTMEAVEMVLGGLINQDLCGLITQHGAKAVGLSGKDAHFLRAKKLYGDHGEDLGLVGEPTHVDVSVLNALEKAGFVPVVAPIGVDENGDALNINADLVAGAIAGALKAEKLILLTDVTGVLDREGRLLAALDGAAANTAIASGVIGGGMVPKVRCCTSALAHGVRSAHIVDGRVPHCILLEIFTDQGVGTQIVRGAA